MNIKETAAIFLPISLTIHNRLIVKIFNFCIFHPIWIKFGFGANIGSKTT